MAVNPVKNSLLKSRVEEFLRTTVPVDKIAGDGGGVSSPPPSNGDAWMVKDQGGCTERIICGPAVTTWAGTANPGMGEGGDSTIRRSI